MGGSLKVVSKGDLGGDPTCSDLSDCRLTSESRVCHGCCRGLSSSSSSGSVQARRFPLLLAEAAAETRVAVDVVDVFVAELLEQRVEVRVAFSLESCKGPAAVALGTI